LPLQRDLNLPYPYPPFVGTEYDSHQAYANTRHLLVLIRELYRTGIQNVSSTVGAATAINTRIATVGFMAGEIGPEGIIRFKATGAAVLTVGGAKLELFIQRGSGTETIISTFPSAGFGTGDTGWSLDGMFRVNSGQTGMTGGLTWWSVDTPTVSHGVVVSVNTGTVTPDTSTRTAITFGIETSDDTFTGTVDCDAFVVERLGE